ncbi:unnamed protein product (mitochondrion) [Plasmodiophora brassicae]|uniref:Uncharacterized protein n=1 Tax=Plasmodiophora brassicae TaxID=37360 RepID=A0A0G4IIH2_PLABS|nr:hypothetical protein PBRA_003816 [Plasmodiophora brassicae]SPQ94332.1 unnamed protein product [Plasmodiophora brassicae]
MSHPETNVANQQADLPCLTRRESVALSGTTRFIAVVDGNLWAPSTDGSIHIRHLASGALIDRVTSTKGVAERFFATAIVACDACVWIGCSDGTIRAYDRSERRLLPAVRRHQGAIRAMCLSNHVVWTATQNGVVECAEQATGRVVMTLTGARSIVVNAMCCVRDAQLWTATEDGVRIWSRCGQFKAHLRGHDRGVTSIVSVGSAGTVWTGGDDGRLIIWDPKTYSIVKLIMAQANPIDRLVAVHEYVISLARDGSVRLWNGISGEALFSNVTDTGVIDLVAYDDDSVWVSYCRPANRLEHWRLSAAEEEAAAPDGDIADGDLDNGGARRIIVGLRDNVAQLRKRLDEERQRSQALRGELDAEKDLNRKTRRDLDALRAEFRSRIADLVASIASNDAGQLAGVKRPGVEAARIVTRSPSSVLLQCQARHRSCRGRRPSAAKQGNNNGSSIPAAITSSADGSQAWQPAASSRSPAVDVQRQAPVISAVETEEPSLLRQIEAHLTGISMDGSEARAAGFL